MTALLSMQDVRFSYGSRSALSGVTLTIRAGEFVALVGPNGAGKTTLLKMLAGLLIPQAGFVRTLERSERVDDKPGKRRRIAPGPRTVAYLAQGEELPHDWSVLEIVELGRMPYTGFWRSLTGDDEDAVRSAMERTRVLALAGRRVATLSGGERQRVALARALAQEPSFLLLDEPTAHLDLRHQVEILAVLRAQAARGVGVVAVLHDLGFAARADRCVLFSRGLVRADGPPVQVLVPELLREVYETDVAVMRGADGQILITPGWPANPENASVREAFEP